MAIADRLPSMAAMQRLANADPELFDALIRIPLKAAAALDREHDIARWIASATNLAFVFEQLDRLNANDWSDRMLFHLAMLIDRCMGEAARPDGGGAIGEVRRLARLIARVRGRGSIPPEVVAVIDAIAELSPEAWSLVCDHASPALPINGSDPLSELPAFEAAASRATTGHQRRSGRPRKDRHDAAVRCIFRAFRHVAGNDAPWLNVGTAASGDEGTASGDGFDLVIALGELYGVHLAAPKSFKRLKGLRNID